MKKNLLGISLITRQALIKAPTPGFPVIFPPTEKFELDTALLYRLLELDKEVPNPKLTVLFPYIVNIFVFKLFKSVAVTAVPLRILILHFHLFI